MNFEPDFRAPNSNDTVLAAAVAAFIIVGIIWAIAEVFATPSHAATVTARVAPRTQSCAAQRLGHTTPEACVTRGKVDEEDANATH